MDYEKKYKEALKRAEKALEVLGTDKCEGARQIFSLFPELKESEDEKIKKELITHCRNTRCITEEGAERIAKWVAWLEKQGESYTKRDVDNAYIEDVAFAKDELENQGKQKPYWSEEDEERFKSCLNILQAKGLMGVTDTINSNWLKSIKERCTWKPSEEQLDALKRIQTGVIQFSVLQSLYNDLKKL